MQLWFIHLYHYKTFHCVNIMGFPGGPMMKNPPSNAGDARDVGSIPGSGRSPGERNGNPLQYSCLENSIYREAWQDTITGVKKSQTRLSMHVHECYECATGVLSLPCFYIPSL